MENVGVPGMLEGRRLDDEGRRAGLTNSPDFFRSIGGFRRERSGSSSLASSSDGVSDGSCLRSMKSDESVLDRVWEILRAICDGDCSTLSGVGEMSITLEGIRIVKP